MRRYKITSRFLKYLNYFQRAIVRFERRIIQTQGEQGGRRDLPTLHNGNGGQSTAGRHLGLLGAHTQPALPETRYKAIRRLKIPFSFSRIISTEPAFLFKKQNRSGNDRKIRNSGIYNH